MYKLIKSHKNMNRFRIWKEKKNKKGKFESELLSAKLLIIIIWFFTS